MSKVKTPIGKKQVNLPDEEYNKMWSREKEFKFIKSFEDPRFGKVTVLKNHKTGEIMMAKEKLLDNKSRATKDIVELKQRMALNHPNLMNLVGYSTSVKKNLCSTHYISRAFYKYPKTDMGREYKLKQKDLSQFSGDELQALGLNSLKGLNSLHEKGLHHGDIRPMFLGVDKASNNNAVLDRLKDPSPIEVTQRNNLMTKSCKKYMSPQLYNKLQGHDKKQQYDTQKNDMYSLGMSMLQLGTMDSVEDVYQKDGKINKTKLNEHLNDFDGKYQGTHPALVSTVHSLLAENEADRPSSGQLLGQIKGGNFNNQQRMVQSTPEELPNFQREEKVVNANPNNVMHQQEENPYMQTNYFDAPKTNYVHSQPQTTNYVQQPQTTTTYIQQQTVPKTTYVNSAPQNNEPVLLRTYVDDSHAQMNTTNTTNFTNYVEHEQRHETYVNSTPQHHTTYVQSTPQHQTTYVNSQPQTVTYENRVETEVNAQPNVTYVNHQPNTVEYVQQPQTTTTYVNSNPQNVTYVNAEPIRTTYVNANPQSTYVQPTTTYVNAEPKTTYVQPKTTYVNAEHTTTYVQPTTTYVNAEPQVTYVQPTTTYVNAEPQVTYVNSQPQTTYVQSTPQYTENYVNHQPQTTYVNHVNQTPVTTTYVNSQPQNVTYVDQTHAPQQYIQGGVSQLNGDVEIRRGSYIPPQNMKEQVTTEKKRYVMQEDGTVIEVDPNTTLENA